jgi:tetratricopeptide (TPR) repeat protein
MLRDGLRFVTLALVAAIMGGITTFLFRSFESHREELGIRWAERGKAALQAGHSAQAVNALRTSLGYAPDDRENQLMLAEALAASGHATEAENYFLNLWQAQPGDGVINVELARLDRSRGKAEDAVDHYRAAVFGTWSGDAPKQRRDIRLELAQYLIERGQMQAALAELTVAAGNNPDPPSQLRIGQAMEAAGSAKDALTAYRNAAEGEDRETAAAKAGELCYRIGDYGCAAKELGGILHYKGWTSEQNDRLTSMQHHAERLVELSFSHDLPSAVRAQHLLEDAHIAQARVAECLKSLKPDQIEPVETVQTSWKALDSAQNRAALRHDDDLQDRYRDLIFASEGAATTACGAAKGDDALLVHLQGHPMTHAGAK